jgi:hypothetical protein
MDDGTGKIHRNMVTRGTSQDRAIGSIVKQSEPRKQTAYFKLKSKGIAGNNFGEMIWKNTWEPTAYSKDEVVKDGDFTMIANKSTTDRAAPVPSAPPAWVLPDVPTFTTESNESVVYSGQTYVFSESGWLQAVRVWVPEISATTNYRLVIIDVTNINAPIYTTIEEPVLNLNDWTILFSTIELVGPGRSLIIYLDAVNSGADTQVTGGWRYDGESNTGAPGTSGWNRRTQNDIIRINKTDLDSVDRSAELLGIIANSEIQIVETAIPDKFRTYMTNSPPVDQGNYVEYSVVEINSNLGGPDVSENCTMTATIPIALPTQYVQQLNAFPGLEPTWASIEGFLQFDGVDQPGHEDTAFGIDLRFTPANVSEDWDLVAISGSGGGGGGAGSTGRAVEPIPKVSAFIAIGDEAETIIPAINTPVVAAGLWTANPEAIIELFDDNGMPGDGQLRYLGGRTQAVTVTYKFMLDPSIGNNVSYNVYVRKNGTDIIQQSRDIVTADAQNPAKIVCVSQVNMSTNDFLEIVIENISNDNNCTISAGSFVVIGAE